MTYYLIKYDDEVPFAGFGGGDYNNGPPNVYVIEHHVETLKEAEEWVADNYNKEYPPYAIKGEKIEFDFTRTVTVIAKSKD